MTSIVKHINHTKGSILVYSQFVVSGLNALGKYLEIAGYKKFIVDGDNKSSYAIISGEVQLMDRITVVNVFNSIGNMRGDIIKVILISKTGAKLK